MNIRGEFTGLKEANASLRKLPGLAKTELGREMVTVTEDIAGRVAAGAPRRTGRLSAAISARAHRGAEGASVVVNESIAPYWKYPEFGTVRMSARPYIRPVLQAAEGGHQAHVDAAIGRADRQLG